MEKRHKKVITILLVDYFIFLNEPLAHYSAPPPTTRSGGHFQPPAGVFCPIASARWELTGERLEKSGTIAKFVWTHCGMYK